MNDFGVLRVAILLASLGVFSGELRAQGDDCADAVGALTEGLQKAKPKFQIQAGHPVILANDVTAELSQILPDQTVLVTVPSGHVLRLPVSEVAFGVSATDTLHIGAEVLTQEGQWGRVYGIYSNGRVRLRLNERNMGLFQSFDEAFLHVDELKAYSVQKLGGVQWGDKRRTEQHGVLKFIGLFSNGEFRAENLRGEIVRASLDSISFVP
jgi:hypothetical protein